MDAHSSDVHCQVAQAIATQSMKLSAPQETIDLLTERYDVLNLPHEGVHENKFFGTCQCNLAPAQRAICGAHGKSAVHILLLQFGD